MFLQARDVMANLVAESTTLKLMTPEDIRKLKQVLLEMMKDIHVVCSKHGVGYSLHAGTCLGAIRHHGFIPWDDDLDIAMYRPDWENFKLIFEETLGDKYVLEAPNYGEKDTKTYFGKIYKKGTSLVEIPDVSSPFHNSIYIDVFIVENVSDNKFIRLFDAIVSDFWKAITTCQLYYKYPNKVMRQYMNTTFSSMLYYNLRRFIGFCFSWISHKKMVDMYDKFVSRHKNKTKNITVPTGRAFYLGEMLPASTWNPLHLTKFEDTDLLIQADPHAYCLKHYGNSYMQLPPENKRERHFCVELDLGD